MSVDLFAYRLSIEPLKGRVFYAPFPVDYVSTQAWEIFGRGDYKEALYKKDMVIVDIGANIGFSVNYFYDHAKEIYALEPNPFIFEALKRNTEGMDKVKLFNQGIMHHSGTDSLFTNRGSEMAESIYGDGQEKIYFKAMGLNTFLTKNKIEHVDLLKVDCEGAEYEIFGSKEFIKASKKIDRIIGEAHFFKQLDPQLVPLVLADCGYKTTFIKGKKNMFRSIRYPSGKEYSAYFDTIFYAQKH